MLTVSPLTMYISLTIIAPFTMRMHRLNIYGGAVTCGVHFITIHICCYSLRFITVCFTHLSCDTLAFRREH